MRKRTKKIKILICCKESDAEYREELVSAIKKHKMTEVGDIKACNLILLGDRYGISDEMQKTIDKANELNIGIVKFGA